MKFFGASWGKTFDQVVKAAIQDQMDVGWRAGVGREQRSTSGRGPVSESESRADRGEVFAIARGEKDRRREEGD